MDKSNKQTTPIQGTPVNITKPSVKVTTKEEGTVSTGPLTQSQQPQGLDFFTAFRQVLSGKRISRISWGNKDAFVYISEDLVTGHWKDEKGEEHIWRQHRSDLEATDWIVV